MRWATRSDIGATLLRYMVAVWTVGLAFAATLLVSPVMQPGISPLFLLAVMISAWRGGLGVGLFATALSALASAFVFISPSYSFRIDRNDLLKLVVFTFAAVVIGGLSAARRRAEEERELLLEREQAARIEAERANAVKDEFIAAASHELRTPLTTIKALTRVLLRQQPNEDERREYLEDIASECDRQIDLVHNLLDLSRIKASGVQIELQAVDAGEVARACEKIERVEAATHQHDLSIEVADDLPPACADYSALRRALCAIIENSIKYTPDGGAITLHAYQHENRILFEIEDTGRGIRPEDLPHIFDKFYRGGAASGDEDAHASSSRGERTEVPGIGLGLHLARVLIEGMDGTIKAMSQVNKGSTFVVSLPAWNKEANARVAGEALTSAQTFSQRAG